MTHKPSSMMTQFTAQVVTTVGYGNQYPKTREGMGFIIFYAIIFVPIVNYAMAMYAILTRNFLNWLRKVIFGNVKHTGIGFMYRLYCIV